LVVSISFHEDAESHAFILIGDGDYAVCFNNGFGRKLFVADSKTEDASLKLTERSVAVVVSAKERGKFVNHAGKDCVEVNDVVGMATGLTAFGVCAAEEVVTAEGCVFADSPVEAPLFRQVSIGIEIEDNGIGRSVKLDGGFRLRSVYAHYLKGVFVVEQRVVENRNENIGIDGVTHT